MSLSESPKSSIARFRAKLKREAVRKRIGELHERKEAFGDFYRRISPHYDYPEHLTELVEAFERIARGEVVELVVTAPPRHSKSETIAHGIAWLLAQDPTREVIYGSYGADLAEERSRIVRQYAALAGVDFADDANKVSRWKTRQGGGFLAGGVGGGQTGFGGDVIIIDDPYKGFADSGSTAYRRQVDEWFSGTLYTRRSPGASFIIVQTRWHPDDLASKRIKAGWEVIKKPAIDEHGNALWPSRFPVAELERIRANTLPMVWSALYQGEPRNRGEQVFNDVQTYEALPTEGLSYSIGVDLAYTEKTSADYSTAVVLARHRDPMVKTDEQRVYVVDVIRLQCDAPKFAAQLRVLRSRFPTAAWRMYYGGTESGVIDFLSREGVHLGALPASGRGDKLVRAMPVAAAWNRGRVLVPSTGAKWVEDFVAELSGFTGINDDHDDQVDALAAAFDQSEAGSQYAVLSAGKRRETDTLNSIAKRGVKAQWKGI